MKKIILGAIFVVSLILPVIFVKNVLQVKASPNGVISTSPLFGKALYLDNDKGNSAYIVVNPITPPITSSITVEAWVKVPKPSTGNYLRDYSLIVYNKIQSIYDYGYIFRLSLETQETNGNARPMFSVLTNSFSTLNSNYLTTGGSSSVFLVPNVWNHVRAQAYSSGNYCFVNLFINGIKVDESSRYNPNCNISTANAQNIVLGKPADSMGGISGYYYYGYLDEVRLSKGIRSAENFTKPTSPFTPDDKTYALFHFDGNLADASGNMKNGIGYGSYSYVDSTIGQIDPTPTPTVKPTATPTPTPTPKIVTPTPTKIPTKTPTPTINHPPVILTSSLPIGTVKKSYLAFIMAIDPDKDYLRLTVSGLPGGLYSYCNSTSSLAKCIILGIPQKQGKYSILATAYDNKGLKTSKIFNLIINKLIK